jgi:3-hydroxyisobutyrate dehydrogenase-like beta-hydroxyacid dehydrogenase
MFRADQMAKDFGLILAAADEKGVAMPVARDVAAYWQEMIATGLGGEDFIACLAIAERAANLKV